MNIRQARNFAIIGTGLSILLFLILTLDSHRQFDKLTNADSITPEVTHGKDVWHKYNCINCHTLFGEGAYYAPDLTKITQHRGAPYLQAYMRDPSKFYDENKHRRLMPNEHLSEKEITDLIAFLDWVSNVDNQGWPPRPILVTGSTMSANLTSETNDDYQQEVRPVTAQDDPRAQGEHLFHTVTPACAACHSTTPGVTMAGPSLAGVSTRAAALLASSQYTGQAKDTEGYIRESITSPSAYVVPGEMFSANGTSFMPADYAENLSAEQIEFLVAYLASLK